MEQQIKMMIVAGESSGDSHAARLVRALKKDFPRHEFDFFGSAGIHMREAGVRAVVDAERMAIIGAAEIARELPMFLRSFRTLKREALRERPDAAVLVDFPDFNLRLARSLSKSGIPVIYYISPQVWAWKRFRVRLIAKYVGLLLSILPFEKDFYSECGFGRVEYVGNPVAGEVAPSVSREDFRERLGVSAETPLISLLPGSRRVELKHMVPELLAAAEYVRKNRPEARFLMPLAPARSRDEIVSAAESAGFGSARLEGLVEIIENATYDALNASDAAAVTSGTATLEAGVIGTPLAVIYKASRLNYLLLRPLISIDTFGLVNLVAGKRIAKELIQDDLTAESLGEELLRLLDREVNADARRELASVKEKLGGPHASARAAAAVMKFLGK